ncbi:MAG: hypothetical protein PHH40_02845 [Candidatus Moranbacteria bacterium]|nr:hypothetical protein [Candidatus Moranbacteria bacterium]MDD3965170.1 hypothetical protein [Candidatus Moranbacteria bacterium]
MNILEHPEYVLPSKEQEQERAERFLLAKNLVQYYFASLDYRNTHPDEETVPESEQEKKVEEYGALFEEWYESKEGMQALNTYIETHESEAIIEEKDMSNLVQSFLAFRNRTHPL